MSEKILRWATLCLTLTSLSGYAAAQQEKIVVLDHADSLIGLTIDGEQAQQLIGHVKFHQGNLVVTCAKAVRYMSSNKYSFEGEAELWDGTTRMVAQRGMYYGDTRIVEAFDRVMLEESTTTVNAKYGKYYANEKKAYFTTDVSVEDTSSRLTADELTYFKEEQRSIAVGKVKIVNAENGLTIYGNRFENFRKQKFSKMTEGPLVIQVDTSGGGTIDTLFVRSSTMEAYQDSSERLVAIDSVRITRGELAAEAGLSTFYTGLDSMVLLKSPVIWYATAPGDEHQVSGDSIFIKMQNRKVRTAYVRGDAMAISRADSLYHDRFNQMTGQEIVMQFVKNKLQSIDVDRTATSLYFLFDEGKGNGVNKSTGDHVAITFLDGRIDAIKVIGGTEGQYFPEKMVARHEGDYNLAGFNWRPRTPASVRRAR